MADAPTMPIETTDAPSLADRAQAVAVDIGTRLRSDVFPPSVVAGARTPVEPRFAKAEADPVVGAMHRGEVVAQYYSPLRSGPAGMGRASAVVAPRESDGGATVDVSLNVAGLNRIDSGDFTKLAEAIPELVDGSTGEKTIVVAGADMGVRNALLDYGFNFEDSVRQSATDVFLGSSTNAGCNLEEVTTLLNRSGVDTSDPQAAVWVLSEAVRRVNNEVYGSVPDRLMGTTEAMEPPIRVRWQLADGTPLLERSSLNLKTGLAGELLADVLHADGTMAEVQVVGSDLAISDSWTNAELQTAVDGIPSATWRDMSIDAGGKRVALGRAILGAAGADRSALVMKGTEGAAADTVAVPVPIEVLPRPIVGHELSDNEAIGPEFGVRSDADAALDPMRASTGRISRLATRHKVAAVVALGLALVGGAREAGVFSAIDQATTSSTDVDCKPRSLIQARLGLGTELDLQGASDRIEENCRTGLSPAEARQVWLTGYDRNATSAGADNWEPIRDAGVVVLRTDRGDVDVIMVPEMITFSDTGQRQLTPALILFTAEGLPSPMDEGVNSGPIVPSDVNGDGTIEIGELGQIDLRTDVKGLQGRAMQNADIANLVASFDLRTG